MSETIHRWSSCSASPKRWKESFSCPSELHDHWYLLIWTLKGKYVTCYSTSHIENLEEIDMEYISKSNVSTLSASENVDLDPVKYCISYSLVHSWYSCCSCHPKLSWHSGIMLYRRNRNCLPNSIRKHIDVFKSQEPRIIHPIKPRKSCRFLCTNLKLLYILLWP